MDARISLDLGDSHTARAVHAALLPEMAEGPDGSSAQLRLDGIALVADIVADDLSTLRAAMNGFVRLADAARRAALMGNKA